MKNSCVNSIANMRRFSIHRDEGFDYQAALTPPIQQKLNIQIIHHTLSRCRKYSPLFPPFKSYKVQAAKLSLTHPFKQEKERSFMCTSLSMPEP